MHGNSVASNMIGAVAVAAGGFDDLEQTCEEDNGCETVQWLLHPAGLTCYCIGTTVKKSGDIMTDVGVTLVTDSSDHDLFTIATFD